MGYLTTLTIRNDALSDILENQERFKEIIRHHASGLRGPVEYSIGHHANAIIAQQPLHADEKALYLHSGNTVRDISSPAGYRELAQRNPKAFKELVEYVNDRADELNTFYKNLDE